MNAGPVAHLNVARLRHGWDDPRSAGFVDATGRVNALAERAAGFVWREADGAVEAALEGPDAPFGPGVNAASLSVWENAEALRRFTYESVHGAFFRRRAEWFAPLDGPTHVLWPVAEGHRPTVAEAAARLARLRAEGPTDAAFDFTHDARARRGTEMAS
jgi:hypothetical protein